MCFAGEQQIDEIAARLGIDPIALRRQNMITPGDAWFLGQQVLSNGLGACLDAVRARQRMAGSAAQHAPG